MNESNDPEGFLPDPDLIEPAPWVHPADPHVLLTVVGLDESGTRIELNACGVTSDAGVSAVLILALATLTGMDALDLDGFVAGKSGRGRVLS